MLWRDMAQSRHDFVVAALTPMTWVEIEGLSAETGLSKWTIQKVRLRQSKNPKVNTLEPLYAALCRRMNGRRHGGAR